MKTGSEELEEPIEGLTLEQSRIFRRCEEKINYRTLHFYAQKFKQLPLPLFTVKWRSINIGSNYLTSLPENETLWETQSESLLELLLSHNHLATDSDIRVIKCLTSLSYLALKENDFLVIPETIFHLPKLSKLDISFNNIQTEELVPRKCLKIPSQLQSLRLHHNFITRLSEDLFEVASGLKDLFLQNNLLEALPSSLSRCRNLRLLDVSHNLQLFKQSQDPLAGQLSSSLSYICTLRSLTSLNISRTGLSVLPLDEMAKGRLVNLRELYAANNKIEIVPPEINFFNKSLRVLCLTGNKIKTLPKEIWELEKLERLAVAFNLLQTFPWFCESDIQTKNPSELAELRSRYGLQGLFELHLGENRLTEFPESITFCESLRRLSLCCNSGISSIPIGLSRLTKLETILLNGCNLSYSMEDDKVLTEKTQSVIPWEQMKASMTRLQEIFCSLTKIKSIPQFMLEIPKIEDPTQKLLFAPLRVVEVSLDSSDKVQHDENSVISNVQQETSPHFTFATAEMQGLRPHMEDTTCFSEITLFCDKKTKVYYFGLFDGHCGKNASVFCKAHFHLILEKELNVVFPTPFSSHKEQNRYDLVCSALQKTFAGAQSEIITNKDVFQIEYDGTTVVVCLCFVFESGGETKAELIAANAGDSRALVFELDETYEHVKLIKRLSVDHRPDEDLVESSSERKSESHQNLLRKSSKEWERIVSDGGFISEEGRVNGTLAVSRGLGDLDLMPAVSSDPYIERFPLLLDPKRSRFGLIIACDGLWDILTDEEAVAIAHNSLQIRSTKPVLEVATKLRDSAFICNSTDNITVTFVLF